jgi:hypothetical protein
MRKSAQLETRLLRLVSNPESHYEEAQPSFSKYDVVSTEVHLHVVYRCQKHLKTLSTAQDVFYKTPEAVGDEYCR